MLGRIQYEDDVVRITEQKTGEVIYEGLFDYDETKDDDWVYDEKKKHYTIEVDGIVYIKKKL